jgi:hypothetical protein
MSDIDFKRVSEDTYFFHEGRDYQVTIKRLLEPDDEGLDQYLVAWSFRKDKEGKFTGGRHGIFSRGKTYDVDDVYSVMDVAPDHCRRIMRLVKQTMNINMVV